MRKAIPRMRESKPERQGAMVMIAVQVVGTLVVVITPFTTLSYG